MAIEYQELNAWQQATGAELTPWEAETIISLSNAYVVQLVKSKEPRCDAPFWKSAEGVDVSAKFKALAKRKRKNG